ncbi:MAG: hypothetical protein BJ554DRAFT_3378 [Olpidium bornovanus]|uniref:Uncharacterized protein n=1 Tax=Olpidium bornovanus TaxID=278681 RepID=A0A8H8A2S7_9FUNG|nr:MAG: hypothetical protein BJ554DRAFT_3378 [Olpidium bornovanus]
MADFDNAAAHGLPPRNAVHCGTARGQAGLNQEAGVFSGEDASTTAAKVARLRKLQRFFGEDFDPVAQMEANVFGDLEKVIDDEICTGKDLRDLKRQVAHLRRELRKKTAMLSFKSFFGEDELAVSNCPESALRVRNRFDPVAQMEADVLDDLEKAIDDEIRTGKDLQDLKSQRRRLDLLARTLLPAAVREAASSLTASATDCRAGPLAAFTRLCHHRHARRQRGGTLGGPASSSPLRPGLEAGRAASLDLAAACKRFGSSRSAAEPDASTTDSSSAQPRMTASEMLKKLRDDALGKPTWPDGEPHLPYVETAAPQLIQKKKTFMEWLESNLDDPEDSNYFFWTGHLPLIHRKILKQPNRFLGYVYLVDPDLRIRWTAHGGAKPEELESMVNLAKELNIRQLKKEAVSAALSRELPGATDWKGPL